MEVIYAVKHVKCAASLSEISSDRQSNVVVIHLHLRNIFERKRATQWYFLISLEKVGEFLKVRRLRKAVFGEHALCIDSYSGRSPAFLVRYLVKFRWNIAQISPKKTCMNRHLPLS